MRRWLVVGLMAWLAVMVAGIAYAASVQVSRPIPNGITVNVLSIQALADIDGNGIVDDLDLKAIRAKLGTRPNRILPEDINHDGIVDLFDLAIVARYFGLEVSQ